MSTLPKWFLEGLEIARKQKAEIFWVRISAPWARAAGDEQKSFETVVKKFDARDFYCLTLRADQFPELNLEVQTILKQVVSAENLSWPLHLFFWVKNGKPIFISHSLDRASLESLMGDLISAALVSGEDLTKDFSEAIKLGGSQDPLIVKRLHPSVPLDEDNLILSIRNPLIQGFNPTTGSFGTGSVVDLYPAAYRGLGNLESDGARFKEMGLVQILKTPLWDQLGGLFHRLYQPSKDTLETEKLLIPNLEMLCEMKDEFLLTKNSFIESCFYDGLKELFEEFVDAHGNLFSVVSYSSGLTGNDGFQFEASDLIEALDATERHLAQKFWGLQGGRKIPYLATTLQVLCEELNLPLTETSHKLLAIRSKLKAHRAMKIKNKTVKHSASNWQKCLAIYLLGEIQQSLGDRLHTDILLKIQKIKESQGSVLNFESLREHVCANLGSGHSGTLFGDPEFYQEHSILQSDARWVMSDSEFSQSLFALALRATKTPEQRQVSIDSLLRSSDFGLLNTLGLKGMGWMSHILARLENEKHFEFDSP